MAPRGRRPSVNIPVIDIHPHVIATDSTRYPRAPLGGHQSAWSAAAPGGRRAADRRAGPGRHPESRAGPGLDLLRTRQLVRGRRRRRAYPDRFTGVFSCDILAPDACDTMAHWMARGLTGLRLFTTGSTMPGQAGWLDDPRSFPAWSKAEERGPPGLPADDGRTASRRSRTCCSASPACASCSIILPGRSRRTGRPTHAADSLWRLAAFPGVYLKVTERNFVGARSGQATPETFFGRLVSEFGASRIAWGSNFPASERSLPELVALAEDTLRFLPETGPRVDLLAHGANALSSAREHSMTLTAAPVTLHSLLGNHRRDGGAEGRPGGVAAGRFRLCRRQGRQHPVQGVDARAQV